MAWNNAAVIKKASNILKNDEDFFDGVLLHELAHGYHLDFMPKGYENPMIANAFAYAKKYLLTTYNNKRCAYKCERLEEVFKSYGFAMQANGKYNENTCLEKNCSGIAYAMRGRHEYFSVLTTFVFKLGGNGTGDICEYDKLGCEMVKKAFNLPKSYFAVENMDPRVKIDKDAGHGEDGH